MKLKKILAVLLSAAVFAGQAGPILAEGNKVEVLPMSDFYENLDDRNYIPLAKIGQITVDGKGDEWADYPSIKPTSCTVENPTITVDVKIGYDDENFYLFTEVFDDDYFPASGGTYWMGDCIQIAMGLPEEAFGDEIGLSYDTENKEPYLALPAGFADKMESVQRAVVREGQYIRYEMAIPWTVPFDEKPDMFKFCLVAADNQGKGRDYVIYMRPGIHDAKYNTYFPTLILTDDDAEGFSWVDGENVTATGEDLEYSVNVLNLGEEKTEKISVEALGYEEELKIVAKSWTRVKVNYNTGKTPGVVEMSPNTNGKFIDFPKSVKVHPTLEVYADRLNDISKRLEKIDSVISDYKKKGIATAYEEVNANTVREFINYVIEDINNKDADRVEYQLTEMEKLLDQAYESLEAYAFGSSVPYDVPKYVRSGPLEIKDNVFWGLTENNAGVREERPVYLIGYGHGNFARGEAAEKFPGVGANYMQMELGPNSYLQEAGPIPEWSGGYEDALRVDENGNHYVAVKGAFRQGLPVLPNTRYRLTFEAYGNSGGECWISFADWNFRQGITLTNEKKLYTYEETSQSYGFFGLNIFCAGEMYLDNVKIYQLDADGNEVPYEDVIVKNGDFEKTEHDSRFYCDFTGVLGGFYDVERYGEAGLLVSFLMSPHYFPEWVFEKYPDSRKGGIRQWDYNSEAIWDMFYKIGYEVARVLKNLNAVNDICVHNEDRHPLYMDKGYLPYFRNWLEEYYGGDISALNENYGTDYASFDEVPMPNGLERNSQTWDLAKCTDEYVTIGRKYMLKGIRDAWPEVTVHGKLQSETIFNTNINRFTQAVEPISQGRLFGVHGLDGGAVYTSGMFVDNKFFEGSPLSAFMSYDYMTSDIQAPILNTEDHIDIDGDLTVTTEIGDHSARYMWESCIHGRCASAIWNWDRTIEKGHINYRPDQMAKIGRAALDVNRLSKEVTALVNAERTVQILYSPPTRNRDYLNLSTLQKVYDACVYSGQKPYILTDGLYDNINHADILIVPAARYATEKLLEDLLEYVNSGKTLVLIGDFCLEQNEYAKMHSRELVEKIYEKATVIPVEYEMDTSYNYVGVNSEALVGDTSHILMDAYDLREILIPIFEEHELMDIEVIDAETGERAKGVKLIRTEYAGKMLADVSYYAEYGVTKRFKVLYKGKEISEMRELRSGRRITDSIVEIEASMPQLLQFEL